MTDFVVYTKEENEKIRNALEFYSAGCPYEFTRPGKRIPDNYEFRYETCDSSEVWFEDGHQARQALALIK